MTIPCNVRPGFNYTVYPCAIDSSDQLPITVDNQTPVKAEVVNRHRESIIAIESELGINPSSTYTTVRARLDAIESAITEVGSIGGIEVVKKDNVAVVNNVRSLNFVGTSVSVEPGENNQADVTIVATVDGALQVQETRAVSVNGQTVFSLSEIPIDDSAVLMFINGIKQQYGVDYLVDNGIVTYNGSPSLITSDIIEFWYIITGTITQMQETVEVSSSGQTVFNLSYAPSSESALMMFVNGLKYQNNSDYIVINNEVTYLGNVTLDTDDIVEFWYIVSGAGGNGGGANQSLKTTLSIGNITGGNNIIVSIGDFISGENAEGGNLLLKGGNVESGKGGNVSVVSGTSDAGDGGDIELIASGTESSNGYAGNILFKGSPSGELYGTSFIFSGGWPETSSDFNPGSFSVFLSPAAGNGNGGAITLLAGDGAISTGSNTSNGGGVNIRSGKAFAGNGGDVSLIAQDGSIHGGQINIESGSGANTGGNIRLAAGSGDIAGNVYISSGNGTAVKGAVDIYSNGGNFALGSGGGNFLITSGSGPLQIGGREVGVEGVDSVKIYTANQIENNSGSIEIASGSSENGFTGNILIKGGDSENNSAGAVIITGGTSSNNSSGNVVINGGYGSSPGRVIIENVIFDGNNAILSNSVGNFKLALGPQINIRGSVINNSVAIVLASPIDPGYWVTGTLAVKILTNDNLIISFTQYIEAYRLGGSVQIISNTDIGEASESTVTWIDNNNLVPDDIEFYLSSDSNSIIFGIEEKQNSRTVNYDVRFGWNQHNVPF